MGAGTVCGKLLEVMCRDPPYFKTFRSTNELTEYLLHAYLILDYQLYVYSVAV